MARSTAHTRLETTNARAKLKPLGGKDGKEGTGRQPHLQDLVPGKAALGYQRMKGAAVGRWLLRQYLGGGNKYALVPLGMADDVKKADGIGILSYEQAKAAALDALAHSHEGAPKGHLTVRRAFAKYIDYLAHQGKRTLETERRGAALIMPQLGDMLVSELTSDRLRKWHSGMAIQPALLRTKPGEKQNTKALPEDDEAIRKRKSSANRVLTMLKGALNHAYDEKLVANNEAWGRRVKPFRNVEAARLRYLSITEAKRLLNACQPDFRQLVQAALETGCRYSELCRLAVADFNPDAGTVTIRKSKSGKSRSVILSPEGAAFFSQITAGRRGDEVMLRNTGRIERALDVERARLVKAGKNPDRARVDDKGEWRPAEQTRPMREACIAAKISPLISFHGLRHTWASLAVMADMPLLVVARNLGHANTRMVERHYGHLAHDYVTEAIRAGAPRFGFKPDKKVTVLKVR